MKNVKIIKHDFPTTKPVYYVKVRHPWFKFWMYLGKYTSSFFFTSLNYKTNFNSKEEAIERIKDYKDYTDRIKTYELINSNRKVIEIKKLEDY